MNTPDTTGGAYCALLILFGPALLGLFLISLIWAISVARHLLRRKVTVLRVTDDEGNVINEMTYSKDEMCCGSRSGATSEMCGGCCGCIVMQLEHYGTPYEIVDD